MNCQPGDIAVCIRDPNMGVLVRVRPEQATTHPHPVNGSPCWWVELLQTAWLSPLGLDGALMRVPAGTDGVGMQDQILRPLRDQPDPDETLSWVPVPATPITEQVTS